MSVNDDSSRLFALMSALAEHTESLSDKEVLEDATAEKVDVARGARSVRDVLLAALQAARGRHTRLGL